MGAHDHGQKVVIQPKPDAEAHKAEVLGAKPQPLLQEKAEGDLSKKVKKVPLEKIDPHDPRFAPNIKVELKGTKHEDVKLHQ